MNPILGTILELLASSAILVAFYFVLFRGKASHRASRLFLVAIPPLSLAFSLVSIESNGRFISFSSLVERERPASQTSPQTPVSISIPETMSFEELAAMAMALESAESAALYSDPVPQPFTERPAADPVVPKQARRRTVPHLYRIVPPLVHLVVMIVLAALITRQMLSLRRIRRRAERRIVGNPAIYFSREIRAAFSVMRSIYVNPELGRDKLSMVISHEKQHIAHRHYVDLIIMEVFTLLLWFDPFVWIVRRELRNVHEFQADRGTLEGGVDMRNYMLAILEETSGVIPAMANGLKSSMIKKRFLKMKTENKIRLRALRAALTVPFAAALMLFFALKSSPAEAGNAARSESPTETATGAANTAIGESSVAAVSAASGATNLETGLGSDLQAIGHSDTSAVTVALRDGWITVRGDSTRMTLNGAARFSDWGDISIAFDSMRRVFSSPKFRGALDSMRIVFSSPKFRGSMDSMRIVFSSPKFRGALDSMRIVFSSPKFKADMDSLRSALSSLPGFRISSDSIPWDFMSPELQTRIDSMRSLHKFSFDKITYSHSPSVSLRSVPQFFGRSDTIIMDMNGQHITVYTRHLRDVREMAERYEKGEISKDEYLAAITNAIKNDVQTEMRVDVSDKPQQLETKDFPADFDFAYHRLVVMPDGRVVSMNDGVEINGVTWALTNVDWSGTFAARPEDFGGYYKHSEAKCPEGWRLPTIREINSLAASGSRWTTVNGVTGREYGSGANTIFLPAAGRATIKWEKPHKWVIRYVTTDGFYWTSTRTGAGGAHDLLFNEGFSGHQPGQGLDGGGVIQRRNGLSVRCVKQ